MARLKKSRKRKEKQCKRCNGKLEEGNFRWCDECQKRRKAESKDSDPLLDDTVLHYLPKIVNDDNGF